MDKINNLISNNTILWESSLVHVADDALKLNDSVRTEARFLKCGGLLLISTLTCTFFGGNNPGYREDEMSKCI